MCNLAFGFGFFAVRMAEVVNCASGDAWRHAKHIEDALLRTALVRIEDCMIADVKNRTRLALGRLKRNE